jgi:hypothetical protein
LPEADIANAAIDDDLYYVTLSETVFSRPLWITPTKKSLERYLYGEESRPREAPLPSTPNLRLHDLRQMGLSQT